jgi:molybdopterin converting factor small subunit
MNIHVEIRVFATLRRYLPDLDIGEPLEMTLEEGTTLRSIASSLGIPTEEVKVILQNGRQSEWETPAEDGARIAFIPAVGGG